MTGQCWAIPGMRADSDDSTAEHHPQQEPSLREAAKGCACQCDQHDAERRRDEPEVLCVVDGRFDPGAEVVVAVKEPVAEPAHHFLCCGTDRDGLQRFGEADDRHTKPALDHQPCEGPSRRSKTEQRRRPKRLPQAMAVRLAEHDPRPQDPQKWTDQHIQQAGQVH